AIAVVGSRLSSPYGRLATEQIVGQLVAAGMCIVSGLALGIDSAGHRAAIKNGGRTLAVMANGLARCYPVENRALMEEVVERGAVLSEYPMEEKPARMNFPERNRIIAALALGTVVAEAPSRSGALITADLTLDENRALYAIPSDITRKTGEGSNALIRQGAAKLILSGRDILEDLQGQLREMLGQNAADGEPAAPPPQLSPDEQKVFERVAGGPISMDDLMARLDGEGMGIGRLSTVLLSLEMKKVIRQLPGKVFAPVS
ncbi:MAG: DNA-protecting protein DprA, partial [Candidatus Sumerlaeota bacterium]|nr:DNA-protecting protein DprA [Candidatus Sumerlaeota bacterium]